MCEKIFSFLKLPFKSGLVHRFTSLIESLAKSLKGFT